MRRGEEGALEISAWELELSRVGQAYWSFRRLVLKLSFGASSYVSYPEFYMTAESAVLSSCFSSF